MPTVKTFFFFGVNEFKPTFLILSKFYVNLVPKIELPIRTRVLPLSMAIGKSSDIPIEISLNSGC
jgi:hypothetical protein